MTPDDILTLWNTTVALPIKQARMSAKRHYQLTLRLREHDADTWTEGITKIAESGFCRGENQRGWVVGFQTLCDRRDFILKAAEGQYDDRFSETQLAAASRARFNAWGSRCRHETECATRVECVERWARKMRASK